MSKGMVCGNFLESLVIWFFWVNGVVGLLLFFSGCGGLGLMCVGCLVMLDERCECV